MQRERAVVAEAVERAPSRHGADEVPVLPLIEERARLLSGPWRGEKSDAVLVDFDLARNVAVQHDGLPRQPFLGTERNVVPRQNPRRLGQRAQGSDYLFPESLEPRAHELNDEPLVVTIADERWTSVGLAVHEPERVGVVLERHPPRDGRSDALVPPRLVDHRIGVLVEQPQRDL